VTKQRNQLRFMQAEGALDFLEELLWALSAKDPKLLKGGLKMIRDLLEEKRQEHSLAMSPSVKAGPSQLLIGVLPQLLADQELFPSNQDIEKFAKEVFLIQIPRWEKRSRYEMIGMLVMEAYDLPTARLETIVDGLARLASTDDALARVKKVSRQTGFSWNETIRSLQSDE
jgi:hypothetical protein